MYVRRIVPNVQSETLEESARRTTALDSFLHSYNHHRCHTALGGQPPISRVNNPAGHYT
ncbi:hypothetical protein ABTY53_10830 [Streptomyces noursei]|uniref:hypothetical protein n=1 Tax=Streptomyces noursei TaxID=1971 RepID=UPI0033207E0C